jgi:hypothetical protein
MNKLYIYIIGALIIFGGGLFTGFKLQKPPIVKVPDCPDLIHKCPPSIKVQSLDLDGIRKIKGSFTFSPVYNGDVYMVSDSIK